MKIIVTGGAGFIGSAVIRQLIDETSAQVVNLDCLTYAANTDNVATAAQNPRYTLEVVDICDAKAVQQAFRRHDPDAILHLAAESHVDRSIDGPAAFVQTNLVGTYVLLEAAREHFAGLQGRRRELFRFVHVSTDEVFGSLDSEGSFDEESRYQPNSPYAATKAGADHLARAWHATYGLPVIVTNCTNNYGPYQYPEKLIPLIVRKALCGDPLPVYGKGDNVRDWLFVEDHARALRLVLEKGEPGRTYGVGGGCEKTNLEVVQALCGILDQMAPAEHGRSYAESIAFVTDRPGHDFRYAMEHGRITRELGWLPRESFADGLRKTVAWYLDNQNWVDRALAGSYRGERLGVRTV